MLLAKLLFIIFELVVCTCFNIARQCMLLLTRYSLIFRVMLEGRINFKALNILQRVMELQIFMIVFMRGT